MVIDGDFGLVNAHFWFTNGREEVKSIEIAEFLRCIRESTTETESFFHIGTLPEGFYDGCVNMWTEASFKVVLTLPMKKRIMNYFGESFIIPFPDMAFFLAVKDGFLKESWVIALDNGKTGKIHEKSVVCHYPFGNVHHDYKICWGMNILPKVSKMEESNLYLEQFFGSETNMDLYRAPKGCPQYTEQRGLIEALFDKDLYPSEWLNHSSIKFGAMVKDFLA